MKKKGFTLIELLAVIVVLAIIALIAVPIVLNLINTAKKGAAESSGTAYLKAVENYVVSAELKQTEDANKLTAGSTYKVIASESELEYPEGTNADISLNSLISISGTKPVAGYVKISAKRTIESAKLIVSGYELDCTETVCKSKGKSDVVAEEIVASNVSYTPSNTEWKVSTVSEALDYLYEN